MPASSASKDCLEAKGLSLPFRSLARLAQNEKFGCTGGEAGSGGGLELEHGRTSTIFPSLVPHLQ
jgi:hypothetical protein